MRRIEIVSAKGNQTRLTIAQDRITLKVSVEDQDIDFLHFIGQAITITRPQTLRGRFDRENKKFPMRVGEHDLWVCTVYEDRVWYKESS